jgi:hypothetical protein
VLSRRSGSGIARGIAVHTDESTAWNPQHASFAMRRINHQSPTRISYGTSQTPDQQHNACGVEERCSGSDRCLEVHGEPAVSIDPGEEPFHHPSARQYLEPDLVWQFAYDLDYDGCGGGDLLTLDLALKALKAGQWLPAVL